MGFKSLLAAAVIAAGAAAVAMPAAATPINGSINIVGNAVVGGSWAAPTSITFTPNQFIVGPFTDGTGDFAFAVAGTHGTISNLPSLTVGAVNYVDFFKIDLSPTTLSFDLTNITSVTTNGTNSLTINGTGTFFLTGKDATAGAFSLTTQCVDTQCDSMSSKLSFSATANSAAVPEPASIALLGAGLAGLGMRRKKRSA